MRKWHGFAGLLIILVLWLAACAAPPAQPTAAPPTQAPVQKPPIVLGAVLSLVGPAGAVGGTARQGIEIALEEINAKGGIDGRKIQLIVEDDEGDPAKATTATTKLIQKDKVVAILGAAVTVTTVAAAQAANAEKVVILSPTFSGDQLTAPGSGMDYVFRVGPPDRFTVGKLVEYGAQKYKKIGILADSGPAGQSVTSVATAGLKAKGIEPVGAQSFDTRAPDLTPQLLNLQKAGAEAIIVQAVPGDAPTVLKGLKQIGWNAQVLGHLGFADPTIRNVALDAAQGVYAISTVSPGKPEQARVMDAYKKKYGSEKLVYWDAVFQSYDAMMAMAEALKTAGDDRSKVKGALESIKNFPAVSGTAVNKINFGTGEREHDGNRADVVSLLMVKGTELVNVGQ